MLNNPLSQPLSLTTNYSEKTSLGNNHQTTDMEIGLSPNNLSKLKPHTLPHIICKKNEPLQNRNTSVTKIQSGLACHSDCISLAALCWEGLTAGMTFCQSRLHSQTKQPCNLVSHFNQVTDKQSISPDYCDDIERTRTHSLQLIPPSQSPTSLHHTRHRRDFQVLPRPCMGYKQTTRAGKQSSCLFNKWLLPWLQ